MLRPLLFLLFSALTFCVHAQEAPAPLTFRLFFIGHEIGEERDTYTPVSGGRQLDAAFHFVDRGTAIDLKGTLVTTDEGAPRSLKVSGRNYRLFASDSEVTIADGIARVRDRDKEETINFGRNPFFPADNYAPIGVQEALIQYWLTNGRPATLMTAPSRPVRIQTRGVETLRVGDATAQVERLSIDGVVWGTETAWIRGRELVAVTTWAGALPFEAIRDGYQAHKDHFIATAAADRVADLERLTRETPPARTGTYALVGARLIEGLSRPPIERGTILVRDGRIAAAGPSSVVQVPANVPVVDVKGKTIIPGLWDMHAHASQVDWAPVYLASGVTTIRDLGGEEAFLVRVRDAIASGKAMGPRYLLAGLIDGVGPRAFGMVGASTPAAARAIVQRYHDEGFQEIKIYLETPPELVPVITAEAHRLGMTVTGHLPSGFTWRSAVEAGYDGIAHMQLRAEPGSSELGEQIAFFKAHHTVMDPTLSWNELSGRDMSQPLTSLLPGADRLPLALARMFASMSGGPAGGRQQTGAARLLKIAVDAGIPVVAGTDKGVPGYSLQRELELYVQGGMTPLEAIQAATIVPARTMKLDRESGSIEAGKIADLVVLEGNPLDDIAHVRTATQVVSRGRLFDCKALWSAAGYGPGTTVSGR